MEQDPNFVPFEVDPLHKPRRSPRLAVAHETQMRSSDAYTVEVRVRNVSTCGFMAECAQPARIGSYVILEVPGIGPVHAQVRWQIGINMGGMFLDPISLTRCEWTATRAGLETLST
jgi:predicted RecB family nuclease